jgi:hypothetical protein
LFSITKVSKDQCPIDGLKQDWTGFFVAIFLMPIGLCIVMKIHQFIERYRMAVEEPRVVVTNRRGLRRHG